MTEAHADFPAQHLPDLPLSTPAVVVDRRILEANIARATRLQPSLKLFYATYDLSSIRYKRYTILLHC